MNCCVVILVKSCFLKNRPFLSNLKNVSANIFIQNFLVDWLLILGLKEGLVECATVFVKTWVILNIIAGYSHNGMKLWGNLKITPYMKSIHKINLPKNWRLISISRSVGIAHLLHFMKNQRYWRWHNCFGIYCFAHPLSYCFLRPWIHLKIYLLSGSN